jgi:XTP/dITP diphosphohydrolase
MLDLESHVLDIVLASSNVGKLKEFSALMSDLPITIVPQGDFNVEDAEETGLTFIENAIIKARHAAEKTGHAALADDSGLVVDALDGKPGIYSARFAGPNATAADNINKLLTEMQDIPPSKRSARFVCVLVLFRYPQDPYPFIYQATWEGEILLSPRGANGFGYDPVFWVPNHQCSAAELADTVKNQISHRAQAFAALHQSMLHES